MVQVLTPSKHIQNSGASKREHLECKRALRKGVVQVFHLVVTLTIVAIEVIIGNSITRYHRKGSGIERVEYEAPWHLVTITWFTIKPSNVTPVSITIFWLSRGVPAL